MYFAGQVLRDGQLILPLTTVTCERVLKPSKKVPSWLGTFDTPEIAALDFRARDRCTIRRERDGKTLDVVVMSRGIENVVLFVGRSDFK
jgi:hypothetical protein